MAQLDHVELALTPAGPVEYPVLRRNLKEAAWCLSDEKYQSTVWADAKMPPPDNMFPFGEAVAYVLDDMAPDQPWALVGKVLRDEVELAAFRRLVDTLGPIIDEIGPSASFADVGMRRDWEDVRRAAAGLLDVIERGDLDP